MEERTLMPSEEARPVYTMQVAVALLGVHPQTLRNYERAGLVQPGRSQGRQRLYSVADIRRLRLLLTLVERYELTMTGLTLTDELSAGLDLLAHLLDGEPDADQLAAARATIADLQALLRPET
jgi:MerR family transcriptional regulator/heat shock protein HspR